MSQTHSQSFSGRIGKLAFLIVATVLSVIIGQTLRGVPSSTGPVTNSPSSGNDSTIDSAALNYGHYCAKCHGEHGDGDGDALAPLSIKPRDFRSPHWRFEKSLDSISNVIRDGIEGTPMPSAKSVLTADQIHDLASHVLNMSQSESNRVSPLRDEFVREIDFVPVIPGDIPNLSLVDSSGNAINLKEIVDGPTIIQFWGTSCAHCIKEMPSQNEQLALIDPNQLRLISICCDQTEAEDISEFVERFPNLNLFVDPTGLAMSRFSTSLMPTFFLVDRQGTVIGRTSVHFETPLADIARLMNDATK